jgi:hypothetical protein
LTTFKRLVRLWPTSIVVVVATLGVGGRPSGPSGLQSPAAPPILSTHPAAFRLGTAARPFGWATGIADFNRDGLADAAVADRLPRVSAGYVYQLQFAVSGLAPRSVLFESPYSALTVNVRDVDHDDDLDVVISETLSREVTNVWLNDGRGRFTEATRTELPQSFKAVPPLASGNPNLDAALEGVVTERRALAAASEVLASVSGSSSLAIPQHDRLRLSVRELLLAPRGPPVPVCLVA